ncbi:unnamed protein product [Echinostoma caproni]|uniref:HECT domain-containing protein n=1 Tax=Echinostoma caproni TaxID=27848 RepID=A0A183AHR1_9TREM|nr:unnamed protein product [Echinostoma caproni]
MLETIFDSCNPVILIDPSTSEADTLSQCGILARLHTASDSSGSSGILLSIAIVKICLSKAQECWMRSQTIANSKSNQATLFASQIRVAFRHLIPSLVLLEHLIPDAYSNAFDPDVQTVERKTPTCPCCDKPGLLWSSPETKPRQTPCVVDRRVLINFLRIASCLFSAAVVCYTDAVRQLDRVEYTSKLKPLPDDKSVHILLQSACSSGRGQVTQLLEAVICGPYFCKVGDEPPEGLHECSQWLRVLHLAARCMLRVFRSHPPSGEKAGGVGGGGTKRGKHRKQPDGFSVSTHSVVQPLLDLPGHGSCLTVLHDWWPVLVNTYVLSLRRKWLYQMTTDQKSVAVEFCTEIGRALSLICNPTISIHQLNGKSQFVTSTNEFQLYKLAAAVSQIRPIRNGHWTSVFHSYPFKETSILPLPTLIWHGDDVTEQSKPVGSFTESGKRKQSSKHAYQSVRFSLTSVCLARAIESMLRHFSILESRNSTSCEMDLQSMIKQITRRLPEEFLVNPAQRTVPKSLKMSRNLIVQTVDFRLNQVKISLLKFCQRSMSDRGQSESPMWFTIVGQARTAVDWYFARLPLPSTESELCDPVVVKDMVACLSLVHRLIFMQVTNLDVLSLSGLMNILKDLLMTERVVQILKHVPSNALTVEMPEPPEYHLQFLFFYLFVICHIISSKHRSKPSQRLDRKSGGSRKKTTSKSETGNVCEIPSVSPEVDLADRVITDPPFLRESQFSDITEFVQVLKSHNLDSFHPLCQLFAEKLDLLKQHFA